LKKLQKKISPYAAETDQLPSFPEHQVKILSKMGIMGMSIPKQYCGSELDNVSQTIIMEAVTKACAIHLSYDGATHIPCLFSLVAYAQRSRKKDFFQSLPP
jgi:alkylation response protein AidB-like acyl-CoA dehydrogenase